MSYTGVQISQLILLFIHRNVLWKPMTYYNVLQYL